MVKEALVHVLAWFEKGQMAGAIFKMYDRPLVKCIKD